MSVNTALEVLTKEQLRDMRDWCLECSIDDTDEEHITDANDRQILRWIHTKYLGGISGFLRDVYPATI